MSGRRSRSKGARTERSIVNALKARGIAAVRVPLSGAVGGRFAGDIMLPLMGRDLCVEVKARADGFRELYSWLNGRDVLISGRGGGLVTRLCPYPAMSLRRLAGGQVGFYWIVPTHFRTILGRRSQPSRLVIITRSVW